MDLDSRRHQHRETFPALGSPAALPCLPLSPSPSTPLAADVALRRLRRARAACQPCLNDGRTWVPARPFVDFAASGLRTSGPPCCMPACLLCVCRFPQSME